MMEVSMEVRIMCIILHPNDIFMGQVLSTFVSLFTVCRVTDLYLDSKVGTGKKERPRLNLTVKKELQGMGGKIVAQSGLAKVSSNEFYL